MVGAGGANPQLPDIAGLQSTVSRTQPFSEVGQLPSMSGTCSPDLQGTSADEPERLWRMQENVDGTVIACHRLDPGIFARNGFSTKHTPPLLNRTFTLPVGEVDQGTAAGPRHRAGWV